MHASIWIRTFAIILLVIASGRSAELSYPVLLPTPKFESLVTSLTPTGGTVNVQLQVGYDLAGAATFTGALDGVHVTGKPTFRSGPAGTSYKFALRAATVPATALSISGTLGTGTAACNYAGPKGRTNILANAITVGVVDPVPAMLHLSPVISDKNAITGAARIAAGYGTNPIIAGTVKGKVSSSLVSLAIKQDKRSASFTGKRLGNAYVGSLRLVVPPARTTITNFTLPLTDVSVKAGPALFRGLITIISSQLPVPAAGSTITVRSDANADGKFLGREVLTAVTDKQGRYQINASVVRGRPVLLEIRRPGFAEVLQAYPSITPGSVLTKNATLQPLQDLTVSAGSAESADGSIRLDGLPAEIESVQARVFDPATEAAQFPGQFADNEGNLLISSVFSTVEASDGNGRAVTNLGDNATLCMRVPFESWASLGDLVPANGQIDVPLYYYDETAGEWKRHAATGWLEDGSHNKLPEAQLAAIRSGTYTGDVFAAGPITHLSWWNIDWPISSHTCIKGTLLDPQEIPVAGASVSAFGRTYNGTSGPATVGPDGVFCLEIMRSEQPGEDVDGDGNAGETQRVQIKVQSGTNLYSFGPFSSPASAATCTSGNGLNVGLLVLNDTSRLTVSNCIITGRVVYSGNSEGGAPAVPVGGGVRYAKVVGYDPDALDLATASCSNCLVTTADDSGHFTLQVKVVAGVSLSTFAMAHNPVTGYGAFLGGITTAVCPPEPVTLEADYFHSGSIVLFLSDRDGLWGNVIIYPDESIRVTSRPMGAIYYVGGRSAIGPPFQLGPWVSVPMRNSTPGISVGTLDFTTTSVYPPGGTWEMSGGSVRASGTWGASF